ncbi:MAG: hypothetical protein U9R15_08070 [Chloroflexota bacterium]|nr:hypothetical protein [Chloroflexota bacterium]
MSVQTVTLQLPYPLYRRASRTANVLQRPVEEILITTLDTALPPLEKVPAEIRAEVDALDSLSDDALWSTAQSMMLVHQQERLDVLLDIQGMRPLTTEEAAELGKLRAEYGRRLLCKARAYALLSERGHPLPDLS